MNADAKMLAAWVLLVAFLFVAVVSMVGCRRSGPTPNADQWERLDNNWMFLVYRHRPTSTCLAVSSHGQTLLPPEVCAAYK